ncbi:MAG: Uncharacterized protein Greene071436_120 [Parcubacteria group bacterium Greene0714_36]|nr:MAG: Uncharacterized protein Greene071436_120 [Parcubacteria group bacterium Greene0714_36]
MEQKTWRVPRNLFLHILMIGTLYATVIGLLVLLFQYINVAFPDALSQPLTAILDAIRRAEAVLLVVFPVFIFLSWLLERDFARDPRERESKVRKWLIYFTLFLSAITIIVDLIILIYNFLGGDLRIQFFLKIAVVLVVAAKVFGYYFWELRRKETAKSKMPRYAAIGSAVFIVAVIVAGFFIVGSPAAQRSRRFDAERVSDLQMIQGGIINYWIYKDALPQSLDELRNQITGFVPPTDPETGASYEYRVIGPLTFEICAEFKTDESESDRGNFHAKPLPLLYPDGSRVSPQIAANETWSHSADRHCFSRAIDPDFYKPEKRIQ